MTQLIYNGPPDQANVEVGLALAERAAPAEIALRGVVRDVTGTDDPGGSGLLEPGKVYDLPRDLADRLLASSDHWQRVTNYDGMTKEQLLEIAAERNIDGRTTMTKPQLADAIRATSSSTTTATGPVEPVGSDPGGVPREDTGQPLEIDTEAVAAAGDDDTTGGES